MFIVLLELRNLSNKYLKQMIRQHSDDDKMIGAICAAPMVLGKMGILENKEVTCYPGFEKYLKGANISSNPVESSKNIITGQGVGAAMKFALELVSQLTDKQTSDELAKKMVV